MLQEITLTSQPGTGDQPVSYPNPEVVVRAKRRTFTSAYKLRILTEASECQSMEQVGAILRREGLYASHLSNWRQEQTAGNLSADKSQARGPKKQEAAALRVELMLQRAETQRLQRQLERAEFIIAAPKKLTQLLEQASNLNKEV